MLLQNLLTVAMVLLAALAVYAVFFVVPPLAWAMLVSQPRRKPLNEPCRDFADCDERCCRGSLISQHDLPLNRRNGRNHV